MQSKQSNFFASANSGYGFINMFGDIFKDLRHLYIIKGGSGTGKSSLMKKAAAIAQNNGLEVEFCLCSSDPDSVDGVIIHGLEIGIIDGTAPHTADTEYPGAYDEIINTGSFWNTDTLVKQKEDIKQLTNAKKECFGRLYLFLKAALCAEKAADSLTLPAIDHKKLENTVYRAFKKMDLSEKGDRRIRLCQGITMNGYIKLKPYKNCNNIYCINNRYGIGHLYLSKFEEMLIKNGIKHTVSYSPLNTDKVNMIYINENDSLFTLDQYDTCKKNVNTERFIKKDILSHRKKAVKSAIKHRDSLMEEGFLILAEIKKLHFELEKIYVSAMDFESMNQFEESLLSKIMKQY